MVGARPPGDVALCRAIPKLSRMVFMPSSQPPTLGAAEVLPAGFGIGDVAAVRRLATLLCALPSMPSGRLMCADMMGASYRMFFVAGRRVFPAVTVVMSGCRVVTGLGPARSWSASTALERALPQHSGVHLPPAP